MVMRVEQTLQDEIKESKRWVNTAENVYKRDLMKRIDLVNWVLEQMKNPDTFICELIETRMNEIVEKINKTDSIIESDPLESELRILDWILYEVCSND